MTRRDLSEEEKTLWQRAMRDVTRRAPPAAASKTPVDGLHLHRSIKKAKADLLRSAAIRPAAPPAAIPFAKKPIPVPQNAFEAGDPKFDRHARRGKLQIDARLDLHGHTQHSAKTALTRFLVEARQRQYRCVLVITGKGAKVNDGAFQRDGVLRGRFREWMREAQFQDHVIRASAAHPRHGGSGAFYLFLKR